MARYQGDPRWIEVKFDGTCAKSSCANIIRKGERAFYYPADRAVCGSSCGHGEKAERDFNAHRIDEDGF